MSNHEGTYSNSRFFESSLELQNPVSPEDTHGHREASDKVALGILCLLLMMAISVWLIFIFQYSEEKYQLQETLNNLRQEYQSMKHDSSLKEEMWRNKSLECAALKDSLSSFNKEQNKCCGETKIVLDCFKHTGKRVEGHWFCCGIKCYYFITDKNFWSGCKQTCQSCKLSLLQIDDEDELKFLKSQLYPNSYWIGLKRDKSKGEWQWTGNGSSKLDLARINSAQRMGGCAVLSFISIQDEDCGRSHDCICEKRISKFPVALSCD